MKNLYKLVFTVLFAGIVSHANAGDKFLIAGSSWNKIALLDKDTKKIEWSYTLDGECNNLICTKKGNIGTENITAISAIYPLNGKYYK